MPSSHPELIHPVVSFMSDTNPESLLDVGCGNGKFGFLAREYLGLWTDADGNPHNLKQLDAIEVWRPYIGDIQNRIYDKITYGNIVVLCENLPQYDMIVMVEVLEHMSKPDGEKVICALKEKSKCLLITTPMQVRDQGAELGNKYEKHQSRWVKQDFAKLGCTELMADNSLSHFIAIWR